MSLSKTVRLTVDGYSVKLSNKLNFYQGDTLMLKCQLNELGFDIENNVTAKTVIPINPLKASLLVETPQGIDHLEAVEIKSNIVEFMLTKKYTKNIGNTKIQIMLYDHDGCQVTLPEFLFEIKENISEGLIEVKGVILSDGACLLETENSENIVVNYEVHAIDGTPAKQIKDFELKDDVSGHEDILIQDNGITKRLKTAIFQEQIDQTNAQLSSKMDKGGEIIVSQINKNKGKLDQTYMTDEFLQQMAGNAPINAVPADNSITHQKLSEKAVAPNNTNFMTETSDNLLEYATYTPNSAINPDTGAVYSISGYCASSFIPVEPDTEYTHSQAHNIAYYDADYVFISGLSGGWSSQKTQRTPSECAYMRVTVLDDATARIVTKGRSTSTKRRIKLSESLEEEIERVIVATEPYISTASLPLSVLRDVKIVNENLIDENKLRLNGYYTEAGWVESQSYKSSHYIKVEPNTDYWCSEPNVIVFYDECFNPVKQLFGSSAWSNNVATSTEDSMYATVNFRSTTTGMIFVKGDSRPEAINVVSITEGSPTHNLLVAEIRENTYVKDNSLSLNKLECFDSTIYNLAFDVEMETVPSYIDYKSGNIITGDETSWFAKYKAIKTYIPVEEGKSYCLTRRHHYALYDKNKKYVTGREGGWKNPLVIPEGVCYLRSTINFEDTHTVINVGDTLIPYDENNAPIVNFSNEFWAKAFKDALGVNDELMKATSKLYGLKWNVMGDSITSTNYARPNWWEIIGKKHNMTVNNYGFSGTTLAHTHDRHLWDKDWGKLDATEIGYVQDDPSTWHTGCCFVERYARMDDDADIITVMGGTNDAGVQLGEWNDTRTDTFYGALNNLLQGLIDKYPDKVIAIFTPIQSANCYKTNVANPSAELDKKSATSTLSIQLRAEAIKRKAKQYGIPCLDLFSTSGISGYGNRKGAMFRPNDTLHPSELGNEYMARVIESFLTSLIF